MRTCSTCRPTTSSTASSTGPTSSGTRPHPISIYGHSKLAGELELDPRRDHRADVVGVRRHAGQLRVARAAARGERETLRFVDHERSRPTLATDLVPVLRRLAVERRPGIHHVTNQGTASRYELAGAILEAAGLDPARVEPVAVDQLDPPRRAHPPAQLGARQRRPARRGRAPASRLPRVTPRPRPRHRQLTATVGLLLLRGEKPTVAGGVGSQERTARAMTSVPNAVRIAR